jgi:putative tricarboxylic transport membrane protein
MKERIVAAAILVFALVYAAGSLSLKVGTLAEPGAGQFPALIAVALLAVAGVHAWRTFRSAAAEGSARGWARLEPAGVAVSLVVYPVLLRTLSFLGATLVVLFVLFRLLGFRRNATSFATALVTTVVSFVVFAGLLGVVLPSSAVEQSILSVLGVGG